MVLYEQQQKHCFFIVFISVQDGAEEFEEKALLEANIPAVKRALSVSSQGSYNRQESIKPEDTKDTKDTKDEV